ncbi:hypothetical protein I3843_10G037700 [Carya illinoinensis]|nr:hypothetical protein I3843_10G037700 [Carya illinoinensis]
MAESKPIVSEVEEAQTQSSSVQPSGREERFKKFEEAEINEVRTPKIQKVIFLLRDHEHFVRYYEPRVVSLGPIHHGKEKYQLAETFKRKLAKEFVKSSGKTIEELCNEIEKNENIKELKQCFEEEVTKKYNDVDLAWILVVDGCAILQYIYLAVEDKLKELNIKEDSVAFCQQDLFLLENQVPYRLLELLMRSSLVEDVLRDSVQKFIKRNHYMVLRDEQQGENTNSPKSRFHGRYTKEPKEQRQDFYPGFLWLPPLIVDDSTGPKLLNLIAYEMCLDFENDFGITSYVSFLDALIDEANDVKELRKAHVLFNLLGSDEKVAQLFNDIGTDLVPNPEKYKEVRTQIQEYYDKTWVTWVAEFFHNHFSSPWTTLAFLGALFALALSATQTWYAVEYSPPGPCDKFCEKFNQNLRKG